MDEPREPIFIGSRGFVFAVAPVAYCVRGGSRQSLMSSLELPDDEAGAGWSLNTAVA